MRKKCRTELKECNLISRINIFHVKCASHGCTKQYEYITIITVINLYSMQNPKQLKCITINNAHGTGFVLTWGEED